MESGKATPTERDFSKSFSVLRVEEVIRRA
jgi:hypothetical protein